MKFILPFLLLLSACGIDDTRKTGMHKNSQSIKESKENGVFLQELKPNTRILRIGTTQKDTIKQIWLEYGWTYENENGSIVIKKDSFQQCLILFNNLSKHWIDTIELKHNDGYLEWNGVLSTMLDRNKDTIFVVKRVMNKDIILDTLIVTK